MVVYLFNIIKHQPARLLFGEFRECCLGVLDQLNKCNYSPVCWSANCYLNRLHLSQQRVGVSDCSLTQTSPLSFNHSNTISGYMLVNTAAGCLWFDSSIIHEKTRPVSFIPMEIKPTNQTKASADVAKVKS